LDWFHEKSASVWELGLFNLFAQVAFDGLWLDWNTPTIFCNGGQPCPTQNEMSNSGIQQSGDESTVDMSWYQSFGPEYQTENSTFYLPFIPQNPKNLDNRAISLNATHHYSKEDKTFMEYDVHPLFGHMQSKASYEILANPSSN